MLIICYDNFIKLLVNLRQNYKIFNFVRQDYKWALMTIEIYSKLYNFVANEINIIREDLFLYFDEIHKRKPFNLLI